ncbi:hypothetical protein ACFLU6_15540, partial [Acidobacteriota bacterium]
RKDKDRAGKPTGGSPEILVEAVELSEHHLARGRGREFYAHGPPDRSDFYEKLIDQLLEQELDFSAYAFDESTKNLHSLTWDELKLLLYNVMLSLAHEGKPLFIENPGPLSVKAQKPDPEKFKNKSYWFVIKQ